MKDLLDTDHLSIFRSSKKQDQDVMPGKRGLGVSSTS